MKCSRNLTLSLAMSFGAVQLLAPIQAIAQLNASSHEGRSTFAHRLSTTGFMAAPLSLTGALPAPIGSIESAGIVLVNGRPAESQTMLWDGELVQAPKDAPAALRLNACGQLRLAKGAIMRVSTANNPQDNKRYLVANLLEGELEIVTEPTSGAFLESAGQAWLVNGATKLTATLDNGAFSVVTSHGKASQLGTWAIRMPNLSSSAVTNAAMASLTPSTGKRNGTLNAGQRDSLLRSLRSATGGASRVAIEGTTNTTASTQPVALHSNRQASMIGMAESAAALTINGRAAKQRELLWDGEIVQASSKAAAQIALANVGQLQLTKGSAAKLTTANIEMGIKARRVLAASLLTGGELHLNLQPTVGAFVETGGKSFTADPGSRFRLSEREGHVTVEIFAGDVREIGSWSMELSDDLLNQTALRKASNPRQYNIRPLNDQQAGYLLNVRPGAKQQLRFAVTDLAGKPAVGVPVVFSLNPGVDAVVVGSLGETGQTGKYFETRTDAKGIALVPFTAGTATGSTSLSAIVGGDSAGNNSVVVVDDDDDDDYDGGPFWSKRNAIPVLAVAAAAVVAGIVVYASRDERFPIQGQQGISIVP